MIRYISSPLPVSPCVATISPRIAIVFSLLPNVPNFSISYSPIFLVSCNTSRPCLYISHSPTMLVLLYFFATRAYLCIFFLLPTTGLPLPFFWQIEVPYTKSQLQHFRVAHWAVQNTLSFPSIILTPPISVSIPPLLPYFLSLAFPFLLSFLLLLSCTLELLYGQYLFLVSSYKICASILSRLRYLTLFQLALLLLSPIQPSQPWLATTFLACSLLYIAISTF